MTSRVSEMSIGPDGPSTDDASRPHLFAFEPLSLWIIGSALTAVAAIYSLWYSAHEPEMDFRVYRMGGQHLSGSGLYSAHIEVLGRHLVFTYPPVAAFLFWPISHIPTFAGQVLWDAVNILALLALIVTSIAGARETARVLGLADRTPSRRPGRPALVSGTE